MAANSPRDPNQPSDDSHIFRRKAPKPVPPVPPEEPIELLDFEEIDGDEDALGGLASQNPGESPSVIVRRGYTEGSAVNLGGSGRPGESGSSIFAHGESMTPSAPGSGWYDSIPPAPRAPESVEPAPSAGDSGQGHIVDDLFAGLEGDSAAVPVTGWKDQQGTDSITESEVLRAFENLSSRDVTAKLGNPDDGPDFNATQESGSNIFAHPDDASVGYGSSSDIDPSGVDLLNPERDEERFTGPKSSIFGALSARESSTAEFDEIPIGTADDDASAHAMFPGAAAAGSSIFDKKTPFSSDDSADRASGTVDWESKPLADEFQPSLLMPRDLDDGSDPFADELTDFTAPTPPQKRGPVGTAGAGVVVGPPPKRREPVVEVDDDDDSVEAPKPKRSAGKGPKPPEPKRTSSGGGGGVIGWIGGGVLGLLVGAGAFAGLYFADLLPAKDSAKVTTPTSAVGQPTVKDNSAELAALTEKNDKLDRELKAAKLEATTAKASIATLRNEHDAALEAKDELVTQAKKDLLAANKKKDTAEAELKSAQLAAAKAEDDAKKAILTAEKTATELKLAMIDLEKAKAEIKTAMTETEKAKLEVKTAMTETEKAKVETKTAMTETEKAKAEVKEAVTLAEKTAKDLEESKKAVVEKAKLATEAEAKLIESQKKLTTAQTGVDLIVKELKANKLIDDKLDAPQSLAALPDAIKKLAAAATSADAKKAAEALMLAKRDLDASQAAVKAAEAKRDLADKELVRAQKLADLKIAEAMDKVTLAKKEADAAKKEAEALAAAAEKKAAADIALAKKETDAAKADAKAQVETAIAKVREDTKKMLANAADELAALIKEHRQQVATLQENYSSQLAEARKGGTIQITPAEVLTQDKAVRDYNAGVRAYQAGSFEKALASLESAVKLDPVDARYWYYLGLVQMELGKKDDAQASFKKGSDLESRSKPNSATVGEALERIQGTARRELNRYR